MKKKTQNSLITALAVVLIAGGIWFLKIKHSTPEQQRPAQPQEQKAAELKTTGAEQQNVWLGTLKTSDRPKKGNLMLVTQDRTIYMQSNRDFSQLLGKNVSVTYQGTWQNFVLGDITLQENQ